MYRYIDRDVETLDAAGGFLIRAMRIWVTARTHRQCPCRMLIPSFVQVDMADALPQFHRMMATLDVGGLRGFRFGAPGRRGVMEDEAVLLALIRLDGGGDDAGLHAAGTSMVAPAMLSPFVRAISRLGDDLVASAILNPPDR